MFLIIYHRIYAVTLGNIPSVVGLAIIAVAEFGFGVAMTISAAETGGNAQPLASEEPRSYRARPFHRNYTSIAQKSPLASVNSIRLCELDPNRTLLIMSSGFSLFYGAWVNLHVALTQLLLCMN